MRKKAYVFDTFQYVKELTKVGVQQKQAEVQVKLMAELVDQTLCTRENLEESEGRLSQRMSEFEVKLSQRMDGLEVKIENVRKESKGEIESLRKDLTLQITCAKHVMIKWLIGTSIAGLSLIFTMLNFLI